MFESNTLTTEEGGSEEEEACLKFKSTKLAFIQGRYLFHELQ